MIIKFNKKEYGAPILSTQVKPTPQCTPPHSSELLSALRFFRTSLSMPIILIHVGAMSSLVQGTLILVELSAMSQHFHFAFGNHSLCFSSVKSPHLLALLS